MRLYAVNFADECEYTEAANGRRASYTTVAEWVFDVWRNVATEDSILRGFRQRGYIGWNGDLSTLHSKLGATVESREVPIVLIEEMNAFLEMKMAEAEENRTHSWDKNQVTLARL